MDSSQVTLVEEARKVVNDPNLQTRRKASLPELESCLIATQMVGLTLSVPRPSHTDAVGHGAHTLDAACRAGAHAPSTGVFPAPPSSRRTRGSPSPLNKVAPKTSDAAPASVARSQPKQQIHRQDTSVTTYEAHRYFLRRR